MKRILLALLLSLMMVFTFAACGSSSNDEETTEATTKAAETTAESDTDEIHPLVINDEAYCVEPKDCDSRGYMPLKVDADGTYTFKAVNEGDDQVTWKVYVMDEPFDDATRYIEESETPALDGDGTLDLKAGQYIYVQSSASSFTCDDGELPDDSYLEINMK